MFYVFNICISFSLMIGLCAMRHNWRFSYVIDYWVDLENGQIWRFLANLWDKGMYLISNLRISSLISTHDELSNMFLVWLLARITSLIWANWFKKFLLNEWKVSYFSCISHFLKEKKADHWKFDQTNEKFHMIPWVLRVSNVALVLEPIQYSINS